MYRRKFLGLAAFALGGVVHTRSLSAMINGDARGGEQLPIILRDSYTDRAVSGFSAAHRGLVASIVEEIIPKTDTPGAIDAGVPKFIELIYSDWMTGIERSDFLKGLSEVDQVAGERFQRTFVDCSPEQRMEILEAVEDKYETDPWYQLDGESALKVSAPFIVVIKELTIFGFFASEIGATQVLRANFMPGAFRGDVPLARGESSWAPTSLT